MKKLSPLPIQAAIFLLVTAATLTSCEDRFADTNPAKGENRINLDTVGIVKQGRFNGQTILYKEIDGEAIWQGDIHLTSEQLADSTEENARAQGAGYINKDYRWPDAVIPYEISSGAPTSHIMQAIGHWEANTPVRFVKRTNQIDYVRFVSSGKNESNIGRTGGLQKIQLTSATTVGTIIHEIGHAVGLVHEHARNDREDWLTVNWENIKDGAQDNFWQFEEGIVFDGEASLDFNSIMLYDPYDFSKNGKPTLVRKDGSTWTPNKTALSSNDIHTVTAMYANLYIRWFNTIYSVSAKTGAYQLLLKPAVGADGAASTVAEDNNFIWTIESNGILTKTHRLSGEVIQKYPFGTGAIGLTGEDPQGFMYAQQGTRLWKINKLNGSRTRLGGVNALENWSGTQAVYYHNHGLYIIWKNTLYKINRTTGLVDRQYGGNWTNVKGMAAPYGHSPFLYMMLGSELWRINTDSGEINFVSGNFSNVTAMSGVGGNLFMVSGDFLYRVNEAGSRKMLTSGWLGANSMGAIHHAAGLY